MECLFVGECVGMGWDLCLCSVCRGGYIMYLLYRETEIVCLKKCHVGVFVGVWGWGWDYRYVTGGYVHAYQCTLQFVKSVKRTQHAQILPRVDSTMSGTGHYLDWPIFPCLSLIVLRLAKVFEYINSTITVEAPKIYIGNCGYYY